MRAASPKLAPSPRTLTSLRMFDLNETKTPSYLLITVELIYGGDLGTPLKDDLNLFTVD